MQAGKHTILPSAAEAVAWACTLLRRHRAIVFVDGRERALEDWLVFTRS